MPEAPKIKPVICRRCKTEAATTDGFQIYLDGKPVPLNPLRIAFNCPACRAIVEWHRNHGGNENRLQRKSE